MRRLVSSAFLVGGALLASEVALQVAWRVNRPVHRLLMPSWERLSPTQPDTSLGVRGNRFHIEHDGFGYRNRTRPDSAATVVLGDSQAYGIGVEREATWPALLGAYNMALPGYGSGQSLLQLDEALALHPRWVVVAPYFGNDFYDAYHLTRLQPQLLNGVDSALLGAARTLDRHTLLESDMVHLLSTEPPVSPGVANFRLWVSSNLRLFGLARALGERLRPAPTLGVLSRVFTTAVSALTPEQRRAVVPLESDGWKTILTPAYRAQVLDDRDPRIRVGFEISVAALRTILARCRTAGTSVLFVLLPTKESVFWPRSPADSVLGQLVASETRLRREMATILTAEGSDVLDMTELLRSSSTQPYFEDVDGHLNAVGHRLVAQAAAARMHR